MINLRLSISRAVCLPIHYCTLRSRINLLSGLPKSAMHTSHTPDIIADLPFGLTEEDSSREAHSWCHLPSYLNVWSPSTLHLISSQFHGPSWKSLSLSPSTERLPSSGRALLSFFARAQLFDRIRIIMRYVLQRCI